MFDARKQNWEYNLIFAMEDNCKLQYNLISQYIICENRELVDITTVVDVSCDISL